MNRRVGWLIILSLAAVAAAGVLAVTLVLLIKTAAPRVVQSGTATIGGPYSLISSNGQSVTDRTYRGKWVLIYFGYTYCPDACPTALNNISVALEKLGADAGKLQPLFVTVDPQRDTPATMADYLKSFDARILGLSGTHDQIDNVIKEFHLYVSRMKSGGDGDNYLVSHSSYIYLMSPQGTFVDVTPGSLDGDHIAVWLRKEMVE